MENIIKIYFLILLTNLLIIPLSTQAFSLDDLFNDLEDYFEEDSFNSITTSSAQIINQVNVSANTGGNVAGEGEVKEGKSEVKVQIENIINGQSIEPIDLEIESKDGEAKVEVEQKITYPDEEGQASMERKVEINEQTETEEYQVEIEDADLSQPESVEQGLGEIERPEPIYSQFSNKFSHWWLSFLGGLKETLASIVSFWRQ